MTLGVDALDRQEIPGKEREHSRSEWVEGGSFSKARNVSVAGNTVYVIQRDNEGDVTGLRSAALGECDPAKGYVPGLSNPPGIRNGDKGCGFAYGNIWWDTASYEQQSAILNLDHPLGEDAELHLDANITQTDSAFRYAPSVGVFSVTPTEALIDRINEAAGAGTIADEDDLFAVGHRFVGHGNRDWLTESEEYDVSLGVTGRLAEDLGYDARLDAWRWDSVTAGNTLVHRRTIQTAIQEGRYDLADPFSRDPAHLQAIEDSSLREEEDRGGKGPFGPAGAGGIGLRDRRPRCGMDGGDRTGPGRIAQPPALPRQ